MRVSPGPSQLYEQWSGLVHIELVDGVVLVRLLVVPTASRADPLPLAVELRKTAEALSSRRA